LFLGMCEVVSPASGSYFSHPGKSLLPNRLKQSNLFKKQL
jgi:hypothetical protein